METISIFLRKCAVTIFRRQHTSLVIDSEIKNSEKKQPSFYEEAAAAVSRKIPFHYFFFLNSIINRIDCVAYNVITPLALQHYALGSEVTTIAIALHYFFFLLLITLLSSLLRINSHSNGHSAQCACLFMSRKFASIFNMLASDLA